MGIFADNNGFQKLGKKYFSPTAKRKIAADFKLAKEMMSYYDMFYTIDQSKADRHDENFDLHSGRWAKLNSIQPGTVYQLTNETFTIDEGEILHLPVIDRVTKRIVADIISTPLKPLIKDNSIKGRNYRDRVIIENLQQFFQKTQIEPKVSEIQQRFAAQLGDTSKMPPEEVQKVQQAVNDQVKKETPEEILDIFEKTRTPEEIITQVILTDAMDEADVKNKSDIGGEYGVVVAEEYYRLGISRNLPTFEVLNPKYVTWFGSEHTEYSEDGVMAKYEQYLTPEDVIQKYGDKLLKADIKSLEKYYTDFPSYYNRVTEVGGKQYLSGFQASLADVMGKFSNEPTVNFMTNEGQEVLKGLYQEAANNRYGKGIRECYITWKWSRRMVEVTRLDDNGIEQTHIRDEHYTFNPLVGDIKIREIICPQVWHGVLLGNDGDNFFVDVEPVQFQYLNAENAWDVKLTIYGGKYNTFHNNAPNASFVDLGKPWNFKLNIKAKRMDEKAVQDLGTLLHMTAASKPGNFSWEEYFTMILRRKIIVSASHLEGTSVNDLQSVRAIQAGNIGDLAADLQELDYWENKIYTSMYFNAAKLGNIGQYATNKNIEESSQAADGQMLRFYNKHRMILERAMTRFMHNALIAYKNNETKKSVLLDDFSKAYLDNIYDNFPIGQMGLTLVNDFEERDKVRRVREMMLPMLQNGGELEDVTQIVGASSTAELNEIASRITRRKQKQAEENHNREIELINQKKEAELAALDKQNEFKAQESNLDRQNKLEMAKTSAMQLANANDINKDGINDSLDRSLIDAEIKRKKLVNDKEIADKKISLEEKKLDSEILTKKAELLLLEKEIEVKGIAAKKTKNG